MFLKCLGSSSSGNCYLIGNDEEVLVLECGIKFMEVKKVLNFNIRKIVGCLVSHEHGDHSYYVDEFLKSGIPVYTNDETQEAIEITHGELLKGVPEKKPFMVGNFRVVPFYVPHDTTPCFAYKIFHKDIGNLLFLTDLEYCKYKFKAINHILVECNYDERIIAVSSSNYSHVVKGHMSLKTCKKFIYTNDNSDLTNVVLLHLSDRNSNSKMFEKEIKTIVPYSNVFVADKGMEIELSESPF